MGKKSIETLVGLFVLLGMAGLVFLAMKAANLGSTSTRDTYTVNARFDNVGGLKVRAPVRTAGVTVGRVTHISLDNKSFQGLVAMEIGRGYRYPRDSAAKILTAGLLGDQYVGLEPGGDDKDLSPGDTLAQTQSAVVLENLIGQFLSGKAEGGADSPQAPAAGASAGLSTAPSSANAAVNTTAAAGTPKAASAGDTK